MPPRKATKTPSKQPISGSSTPYRPQLIDRSLPRPLSQQQISYLQQQQQHFFSQNLNPLSPSAFPMYQPFATQVPPQPQAEEAFQPFDTQAEEGFQPFDTQQQAEGSQVAPESDPEVVPESDEEEPEQSRQGKAPTQTWLLHHQVELATAWCVISEDQRTGKSQGRDQFFKHVTEIYNQQIRKKKQGKNRSIDSCNTKWTKLNKVVQLFRRDLH